MKFTLLILLIFTLNGFGQGRKNLDTDFGIKKFKLETSYDLYKKDLKYIHTNRQGIEFYDYTKTDIKEIFGVHCESIMLGFYENKLYTISFLLGVLDKKENLAFLEKVNEKYDLPEITENDGERNWVAEWTTGKTHLQAGQYTCQSPVFSCKTELFIYSRKIKRQIPVD